MKILISCFSRTGYTERLAKAIARELESRGHILEWEPITPAVRRSCIRELAMDWPRYPAIALGIVSPPWRRHYFNAYHQVEEDIRPLRHPDVSGFDRVCIGGPKWAQLSYPVARYIRTVKGLGGMRVGSFTTFGGPPLRIFETEFYEKAVARQLAHAGAEAVANLGVSSAFHEAGLMPLFRLVSLLRFGRFIASFTLESEYAHSAVRKFCSDLVEQEAVRDETGGERPPASAGGRARSISSGNGKGGVR